MPHREQNPLSRRRLLQLTGATALGALAGCAGQLPGNDNGGSREVTPRSTVTVVSGNRWQVTLDVHADSLGRWLFYCHNLYHLDAGMAVS